ncbi:hypothetical protein [Aquimarina pacifica]|nr:hypothetical protein [Aquimarina pacifica]
MKSLKSLKDLKGTKMISKDGQKNINGGRGMYCCSGTTADCARWCTYWV